MIGPIKAEVTAQKNAPKFANPTIAGWHVSKAWIKSIGPIDAWKAITTQIILIIVPKLKLNKLKITIATRPPVKTICPINKVFFYPKRSITRVLKKLAKKLAKLVKKIAVFISIASKRPSSFIYYKIIAIRVTTTVIPVAWWKKAKIEIFKACG